MKCVWVLFFHWSLSGAEWFKIEKGPDTVVTALGSGIVLPCSLTPTMSAVDMEVKWSRQALGKKLVHHYMNKEDKNEDQDRSYRGRTALFKEELQYGNTSLLLKDVTVSDPGQYTCEVQGKGAYDKITVKVIVEAKGTPPEISVVGTDDVSGGIQLLCESKGWNPEPQLQWLNNEGAELPAEPIESHRDNGGFNVGLRVTAYRRATDKVTCRMTWRNHVINTPMDITGIGTNPNITEESTDSPGTRLLCETKGWKSKPELEWLSGQRTKLTDNVAESQEVNGLYTVKHRVTAHGSGTYSCSVKQYPMMEARKYISDSSQPKDTGHSFTSGQSKTTVILIITGIVLMLMVGVDI